MGILDDAIREHLDLKRRQGAADDELKRLEDEAFGPPSRPGDPDFPQPGEETSPPEGETAPAAVETMTPADELEPVEAEGISELPDEIARAEDAATEAEEFEPPAAGEPTEVVPPEEGSEFFDREGDLDLDLDLEIEEEAGDVGELDVEEPEAAAEEAPIETLPTVEHHFEEAIDEAEVVEEQDEEAPPPAEEPPPEEPEAEGEDVLEETPEFLRDAPEDDELWFEQGEPKDFDF
jgi:hypothetical protein